MRNAGGRGGAGQREIKGRKKKWDNCNSIINEIYFKKFYIPGIKWNS